MQSTIIKLLTEEDNIALDEQYPERRRGTGIELLRLIWSDPNLTKKHEVEVVFHQSFLPASYYRNPSLLPLKVHQSYVNETYPFTHFHAFRDNQNIHVVAAKKAIIRRKSFTDNLIATLQNSPIPSPLRTRGTKSDHNYTDIPFDKLPETYRNSPQQLKHRLAARKEPVNVKIKPFREFLRIWLLP